MAGPPWVIPRTICAGDERYGLRKQLPVEISGYNVDNSDTYAAIWVEMPGPWPGALDVFQGIDAAEYQRTFDRLTSYGYRLVSLCGFTVAGQDLYAGIFVQMPSPDWVARHGLPAADYQQEFDTLVAQGYRLVDVSGYNVGGEDLYTAIWEQSPGPDWVARHGLSAAEYQQEFDTLVGQGYRLSRANGWPFGDIAHYAAIWEKKQGPD